LLLLSHLDVVAAQPDQWTHPPFSGLVKDGTIWGRGALDCKNLTALEMAVMMRLAQEGAELDRDVILAATADEESGGRTGVGWLCANAPEEMDAEYCINEGGGYPVSFGGTKVYMCNVADKGGTRMRFVAKGKPGHASIPKQNTAIARLCEALLKLMRTRLPIHPTPSTERFVAGIIDAVGLPPSTADLIFHSTLGERALNAAIPDDEQRDAVQAMLRNTAMPTIMQAGYRINIIPESATADIDGRVLPGHSPDVFIEEVRSVVGDLVDIEVLSRGQGTESPPDTDLFRCMSEVMAEVDPGAKVVPMLATGGTDARFLRPLGTIVYGFVPSLPGEALGTAHGIDERCTVKGLEFGFETLYRLVKKMAAR
jgi:acetylornithine deacetylase/succinyl-diaminopimelate desuccinylase-like protein